MYDVRPLPCFPDVDKPFATGYIDDEVLAVTDIWDIVVTDWYGLLLSGGDSSLHYRRDGGVDPFPWTDYVDVGSRQIDHQYGVEPSSIIVTLSGLDNL